MTNWIGYCPNAECIFDEQCFDAATKEDALIPLAQANDLLPGERIAIGVQRPILLDFDAASIAADIVDHIAETTESVCDNVPTEHLTDDDVADLEKRITIMLEAWMDERDIRDTHHWLVEDETIFTIPDYLDEEETDA